MCGRYYVNSKNPDDGLQAVLRSMEKNYPGQYKTEEIRPGDPAPALIAREGKVIPVPARFGFPKEKGSELIINARSETAAELPTFTDGLRERRILLPATGFYEWTVRRRVKYPYMFCALKAHCMYFCGIYKVVNGELRFVIMTCPSGPALTGIHPRQPVIALEEEVRPYLTDLNEASKIMAAPGPELCGGPI